MWSVLARKSDYGVLVFRMFFCAKKEEIMSDVTKQTRTVRPGLVAFVAAFSAFLATFNETFLNIGFATFLNCACSSALFTA